MSAQGRTARDQRRRQFGQNFLEAATADRLVDQATFRAGELVVEIGAGSGAITLALARGVRILAIEPDPEWARRLRERQRTSCCALSRAIFAAALPAEPFRVFGSAVRPHDRHAASPSDDPRTPLWRADVIVQWEVACKRAAVPPSTLLSTTWAPWWEIRLGPHIPAQIPTGPARGRWISHHRAPQSGAAAAVDGAVRAVVRQNWPFEA